MHVVKKILKWMLIVISVIVTLLYIFDFDYILKGIRVVYFTGHTTAFIDDTPYFDTHTIEKGKVQPWDLHTKYNQTAATKKLDSTHKALGTVAFMIVKNDSIFHEYYTDGYSNQSQTNSFSMAKSITTAMLFKAIDQGYIKSLDTPVHTFFPEIAGEYAILGLKVTEKPGESFKYLSGATQLLGMVIEKATQQTLSKYLSENFWKPMGMSQDALWQLDSDESALEKTFCCVASNARDFGRFGQLWMKNGKWNGKQLIPEELAIKAQQPRFKESSNYGYSLWLANFKGFFIYMEEAYKMLNAVQ